MQILFSCLPARMSELERVISPARVARFSRAVQGDTNRALRLYLWNSRLCAELYLPLQLAEVATRNGIHEALTSRFGPAWYNSTAFTPQLTQRYQDELAKTVADEQQGRGAGFAVDHVVGGMTFGFWVHLLTTRYSTLLWPSGFTAAFPLIHPVVSQHIIHTSVDRLRRFRNRVFHHYAIFDASPTAEYANLLKVLGWISEDAVWLAKETANPAAVIARRPTI